MFLAPAPGCRAVTSSRFDDTAPDGSSLRSLIRPGSFVSDATAIARLAAVAVLLLAGGVKGAAGRSVDAVPALPPPAGVVVRVSTEPELQAAVAAVASNTTILVAPGTYRLTRTLWIRNATGVTLRGATDNRDDVALVGPGMRNASYGDVPFGIWTDTVGLTVANMSLREFYFHALIFNSGAEQPHLYNLRLGEAGEQIVKVNPDGAGGGVDHGLVEYTIFEFADTSRDDYTKGIDIQAADGWIIRDNLFRNIRAPQGQQAGPAVLAWRGSRNTVVERNTFLNCQRGIDFGVVQATPDDHWGGVIRNNFYYRAPGELLGDTAINVWDSPGTRVVHNTVLISGTYGASMDVRWPGATGVLFANNLADAPIWHRDGANASEAGNSLSARPDWFAGASTGDLHLVPGANVAIDGGVPVADATDDWDGGPRPSGAAADIGADEVAANPGGGGATFVGVDTTTQGTWRGVVGSDGYLIVDDATALPAYAHVSAAGQADWTWAASTADVRALQKATAADRLAATWYGATSFGIDVNLTDGLAHQVALYALDWDARGRVETIEVLDAITGVTLDRRTLAAFAGGQYLVWQLRGHVLLRVTRTAGDNAVVAGLFFGGGAGQAPATADFVGVDTTTQGSWRGVVGDDGYVVVNDASSLPAATVTPGGHASWTWIASTPDVRALQHASAADRLAATWYAATSFGIDVNLTDGAAHRVALYALDWDARGRAETIQVLAAASGAVLDTRALSGFTGGQYIAWRVRGHVLFRVTRTAGDNAVVSAVFLSPSN